MTTALATMRVDYDQVKIKDLDTSNNPLLNKRRNRPTPGATGQATEGMDRGSRDGDVGCISQREAAFTEEHGKTISGQN